MENILNSIKYQDRLKNSSLTKISLGFLVAGAIASVAAFFVNKQDFFFAYLNAYIFWLSIGLGSLFFTMLHHIVGAEWSVVIRRIAESVMMTIPYMAVLFIPILFGLHDLYHWTHKEVVANDAVLQHKEPWLNDLFFIIRALIYFAIWSVLSILLYRLSIKQDKNDGFDYRAQMKKVSAPGILLFALSITFAGWDWLMSLDPHWFSTMFGVFTFAGIWWLSLAFLNLLAQYIRKKASIEKVITVEHFHDIGKLMFGFTVFWAYIAFSQFMLIWYASIPEETVWFRHRWEHGWEIVSTILILSHFVIPFLVLAFRSSKRNLTVMKFSGLWFMLVQWLEYFWIIFPSKQGETNGFMDISWMHVAAVCFIGGAFFVITWNRITSNNIVPIGDPNINTSINFINQ